MPAAADYYFHERRRFHAMLYAADVKAICYVMMLIYMLRAA